MLDHRARNSKRRFYALCFAMISAIVILLGSPQLRAFEVDDRIAWGLAMLPLFTAVLFTGFTIRVRGEEHAVFPSDAILPIAVVFASPVSIIISRTLALILFAFGTRPTSREKLMFNVALDALDTACAFLIVYLVLGTSPPTHVGEWFVVAMSVALTSALNYGLLSLAIRLATGRGTSTGVRATASLSLVMISLGCLIAAVIAWYWPMVIFVFPALFGAMILVKDRGRLLNRNDNLTSLENFSRNTAHFARTVSFFQEASNDIHAALDPVATFVVRFETDGSVQRVFQAVDVETIDLSFLPNNAHDERWPALGDGAPARYTAAQLDWLPTSLGDVDEVLVTSFEQAGTVGGTIVLINMDRLRDPFTREQIELLEAMKDQLALSSEVRGLVADLEHAATHDPLTGLLNRMGLEGAIGDAYGVVVLFDLANFKDVNEALGHEAGNYVIRAVAGRLASLAEQSGHTVARYGGDQFALFAPVSEETSIEELLGQYRSVIGEQVLINDVSFRPLVRMGWLLHSTRESAAEAIRRAEVALNAAKYESPGTFIEYDAELDSKSVQQLELLDKLVRSIEDERLEMHYQPKLDIKTGLIVGFEALVRWPDGKGGSISPAVFVPIAEQQGEGRRLTQFVLETSMRQAATWKLSGFDVTININVGVRDLLDDALPNLVGEQLMATGLTPSSVVLEITESTMMRDVETVVRTLTRLRELGVGVSVDDFGTGYSSLAYLARLPITELKVDRSFVSKMNDSAEDRFIVTTAVALGQQLGLSVVAEGVEDIGDLRVLAEIGCDEAQGFGIGRPMPNAEILAWSHSSRFKIRGLEDDVAWRDEVFGDAIRADSGDDGDTTDEFVGAEPH